jgi:hypothetical protein
MTASSERHRATQLVPLLLVLASGLLTSRAWASSMAGQPVHSGESMPTSANAAFASGKRSAQ